MFSLRVVFRNSSIPSCSTVAIWPPEIVTEFKALWCLHEDSTAMLYILSPAKVGSEIKKSLLYFTEFPAWKIL
jgi:hypothetical protein